ncbi:MAG: DUF3443 family protein [Leptospirales bacterium]
MIGLCAGFLLTAGCGSGSSQGGPGPVSSTCQAGNSTTTIGSGLNTLPLYLGSAGTNSSAVCGGYLNAPCTDVTICDASGNCQTISNVLVDSGSSGFRIFKSVLSSHLSFTPIAVSGNQVGECAKFGNGSYGDWGGLVSAQITLGGEPPVTVPIQIIDPAFAGQYTNSGNPGAPSPACGSTFSPDTSPGNAGFNAILGVGPGVYWCGSACTTSTAPGDYFICPSNTCTGTILSEPDQDQNPVASLTNGDQNGVALSLPCPAAAGSSSLTGTLYIGIGTRSNNTPATGVTAYPSSGSPDFVFDTTFNGHNYNPNTYPNLAFIDSGSPTYYFTDSSIPTCSAFGGTFYCPSGGTTLSAIMAGDSGSPSITVDFSVDNPNAMSSGSSVFDDIAKPGGGFDWGMPFFFGREVFVGINGKTSSLGTGPYWAF